MFAILTTLFKPNCKIDKRIFCTANAARLLQINHIAVCAQKALRIPPAAANKNLKLAYLMSGSSSLRLHFFVNKHVQDGIKLVFIEKTFTLKDRLRKF